MTSNALIFHNTFSKRNFVSVAKSITKQYEENMKKICEVCEDSGFRIHDAGFSMQTMSLISCSRRNCLGQGQSTVAPDSVPGTHKA